MTMLKIVLFLVSFSALAQEVNVKVLSRIKHSHFDLGIGSQVELDFKTTRQIKKAIFLGRMINQEGETLGADVRDGI